MKKALGIPALVLWWSLLSWCADNSLESKEYSQSEMNIIAKNEIDNRTYWNWWYYNSIEAILVKSPVNKIILHKTEWGSQKYECKQAYTREGMKFFYPDYRKRVESVFTWCIPENNVGIEEIKKIKDRWWCSIVVSYAPNEIIQKVAFILKWENTKDKK